nr:unnamed protein product [Digitaria exilis]
MRGMPGERGGTGPPVPSPAAKARPPPRPGLRDGREAGEAGEVSRAQGRGARTSARQLGEEGGPSDGGDCGAL